ncbi:MAG: hypothetical protein LH654_11525 [Thermoleophilia bacterium]|nr:hypothetical protein [Thermoleophilia bacterium]
MTAADPRSEKVAVVPEASFVELLPELPAAGYGLMQLPPADLAPSTAAEAVGQLAEQVAEYRRNGYEVVLAGTGAWCAELDAVLARLGLEPLARRSA